MAIKNPVLLAVTCALMVALPTACSRGPSRIATGEEIGIAVKNAELQMMQARATREWRPCDSAPDAGGRMTELPHTQLSCQEISNRPI